MGTDARGHRCRGALNLTQWEKTEMGISDAAIQNLKTSLTAYLDAIGIQIQRGGRCACPVHNGDSKTTAYLDTRTGVIGGVPTYLHCPKCDKRWDVISLHAVLNGLDDKRDFISICEAAARVVGIQLGDTAPRYNRRPPMPSATPTPPADAVDDAAKYAANKAAAARYISEAQSQAADALPYLQSRGISQETARRFGIGFKDGRVVIPSGDGYVARSIKPADAYPNAAAAKKDRHRKAAGVTSAGFGWGTMESGKIVWIVEGEFDALSLFEVGKTAAALGGVDGVPALCRHLESRADFETDPPRLLLALDDDSAGNDARAALELWASQKGVPYCVATAWHEIACNADKNADGAFIVKDANDVLRQMGAGEFKKSADDEESKYRDTAQIEAEKYELENLANRLPLFWRAAQDANSAIKTGFPALDAVLGGGLRPGLYGFGAIPSLGKTALVLQIADTIAAGGVDVLYFSLEMPAADLAFRSISRMTYERNADAALLQRELQFTNWERFSPEKQAAAGECYSAYATGAASRMWIYDKIGELGVDDVQSAIATHKKRRGVAPVVVIDYLQILKSPDPHMTDKAAIDANTLRLKQISNTYAVPIMLISSFNRANYASEATFEAFKESGAIEYCTDTLLSLNLKAAIDAKRAHDGESADKKSEAIRQAIKTAKAQEVREIELSVLKNRAGRLTGDRGIFLKFATKYSHFSEAAF